MKGHAVQLEPTGDDAPGTIAIAVWYSNRHAAWVLERLDESGNLIGLPHRCGDGEDESHCLEEWIRDHGEHHDMLIYRHPR